MAIPLLVATHAEHDGIVAWWEGREVALCGHAAVETYSVLTRLPGDLRVEPADAARRQGQGATRVRSRAQEGGGSCAKRSRENACQGRTSPVSAKAMIAR